MEPAEEGWPRASVDVGIGGTSREKKRGDEIGESHTGNTTKYFI
jgi:hypothetical protein